MKKKQEKKVRVASGPRRGEYSWLTGKVTDSIKLGLLIQNQHQYFIHLLTNYQKGLDLLRAEVEELKVTQHLFYLSAVEGKDLKALYEERDACVAVADFFEELSINQELEDLKTNSIDVPAETV